jgi:hypothetical protein
MDIHAERREMTNDNKRANTDWPAVLDGCRTLLAIAFGKNIDEDNRFENACREADRKAVARPQDFSHLKPLRPLLDDDVSLERAYHKIRRARPAPESLVEALMYSLRRGVHELTRRDAQQRLSALNEDQLEAVCLRVQAFKPEIARAWSADDTDLLISAWRKFREQR